MLLAMPLVSANAKSNQSFSQISHERKQQLTDLLLADCGSCHGQTMKGGLGPALLPETLSDKPDLFLFNTIKYGRKDTPMPPWKPFLTDAEIKFLISLLRKPDLIRENH